MRTTYSELIEKQRKEFNELPIAYAFGDREQLSEALKKLGANTMSECCTLFGHGDIVKKVDAPNILETMKRHDGELREAMKDPEFAYNAFLYEMDNHEYAINWSADEDVLNCFGMDMGDVKKLGLQLVYNKARQEHMRKAHEEWDMI